MNRKQAYVVTLVGALTVLPSQTMAHHVDKAKLNHHGIGKPHPISSSNRQYDFFIGDWDFIGKGYDSDGNITGTSKGVWWADYTHDKQAIFDNAVTFTGDGKLAAHMPAIRTYAPEEGHWFMDAIFPLSGSGKSVCESKGTWKNNEMHTAGTCFDMDGTPKSYSRVRFFNITEHSFSYTWESSPDRQKWTLYGSLEASRRPNTSKRPDQVNDVYDDVPPTEIHQYDFLIGKWNITTTHFSPDKQETDMRAGTWSAKPLHGGRAVHDHIRYQEGSPSAGPQSIRTYSPKMKGWSLAHVTPGKYPALCNNTSRQHMNEMHETATCLKKDGSFAYHMRARFHNITKDSFSYTEENNRDNISWAVSKTILAKRAP